MDTEARTNPLILTIVGLSFLVIGLVTTFGTITLLQLSHAVRFNYIAYILMDLALALGFLRGYNWVLIASILNLSGVLLLMMAHILLNIGLLSSQDFLLISITPPGTVVITS